MRDRGGLTNDPRRPQIIPATRIEIPGRGTSALPRAQENSLLTTRFLP